MNDVKNTAMIVFFIMASLRMLCIFIIQQVFDIYKLNPIISEILAEPIDAHVKSSCDQKNH